MNTPNKTFYFPQTVYSDNILSEWEKEYEIENSLPNMQRLIRIDSNPAVNSTKIDGNTVEIDGKNNFSILYHSSEDDKIHFFQLSEPFKIKEKVKSESEYLIPFSKVFCNYISCKVISPRKIFIKSKNQIDLSVKENVPVNVPNVDESKNVLYFNTEAITLQTFIQPTIKTFNLEESLVVDGTYPPVENIIFSTVRIIPNDVVKNIGSSTINTTVLFKVFYETNEKYYIFSRSIPLSLTVEDEDIDENTLIYYYLSIAEQSVKVQMDNYGEDRILNFSYIPEIILFKVKETTENVPLDVFSPSEIFENITKNVSYEELTGIIQRPFTVEKIFEIPETEFTEIFDTSAVMNVDSFTESEQGANLQGICGVSVLGMTERGIDCASFTVNFNQIFPEINDNSMKECSVIPIQATTTVSGRNMLTIRISANATIRQYNHKNCSFISDFNSISSREERDKSCITIFYPSKDDTLWDIAKEYGIDPKDIAKENKSAFTQNGNISENAKTIFIP